jgi:hypothetical protein
MRMRTLTLAPLLGALSLLAGNGPLAAEARWCAENGGDEAYRSCGYHTREQCKAGVSGVGGYCFENPAWVGPPAHTEPRRKRSRAR